MSDRIDETQDRKSIVKFKHIPNLENRTLSIKHLPIFSKTLYKTCVICTLKRINSPKNENSVIIYWPLMPMESQVKHCSPQNFSGYQQKNSVAAFSWTAEVERNFYFRKLKKQPRQKHHIAPYRSSDAIPAAGSSMIPNVFVRMLFTPLLRLKLSLQLWS